jgi:hypothetical protein
LQRLSTKLSPTARRAGGGFTTSLLLKASKIVPHIVVDGFIFHASVSQYHSYVGACGNEVNLSHDEWGNTPSSMPSLRPCEAAAFICDPAGYTTIGQPSQRSSAQPVTPKTPLILSTLGYFCSMPALSTDNINVLLPLISTCLLAERDVLTSPSAA